MVAWWVWIISTTVILVSVTAFCSLEFCGNDHDSPIVIDSRQLAKWTGHFIYYLSKKTKPSVLVYVQYSSALRFIFLNRAWILSSPNNARMLTKEKGSKAFFWGKKKEAFIHTAILKDMDNTSVYNYWLLPNVCDWGHLFVREMNQRRKNLKTFFVVRQEEL